MAEFTDLLALPALHTFVRESGFRWPTAVQSATIPRLVSGRSVSVLAQTGSGKTLAYALPIVELLKKLESASPGEQPLTGAPRAWILSPTRELGAQIEQVFKSIAHRAKLRVRHLRGGVSRKQTRALVAGPIDVLISSPQRALHALKSGALKRHGARFVIFDEADQLLDRGFLADVKELASRLGSADLQVGLFSATMPPAFVDLRNESFPGIDFDEVVLQGSHTLRANIATSNYTVPFKDKLEHTVRLLKKVEGSGFLFVNLKRTAEEIFGQLTKTFPNRDIHLLHGGMDKRERRKVLARFIDSDSFLVCTDIAARGLDLPGLSWVINYDLPFEAVYYVHRCGRVGRTGEPAQVFNLVTTKDRALITRINTAIANQSSVKLSRVQHDADKRPSKKRSEDKRPSGKRSKATRPSKKRPGTRRPSKKRPGTKRPSRKRSKATRPSKKRPGTKRLSKKRPGTKRPSR